ncbi:hypothetical protein EPUS_07118 [Endocarpon pusillum Z07020]|uniref:SnoaL-like domain-containing protein n=1 Tax=Endocarpon pusillum (strain Z07020 / HMAS-L-300199) TaxID=1263415 RepID=U1HUM8_ENDPU|nr:uncharacterized protein EPUS_07118 [Endocarpon pusillum Z07020]ERF73024.1 hypothetical protein EPUS_07118 [Endocarpon pusillum Z07020]
MSPPPTKEKFDAYLKAFNTHNASDYGQYYAVDFHVHLPGVPPTKSRAETVALFETGLSFCRETLHPTWLQFTERSVAMEACVRTEALVEIDFPFPFTGKTYKKGEKFTYPIIVHYEYNDDLFITTFRSFSEVLNPDPGYGIAKEVLPGYD